jgi:uncharacterized protein YjbJ (UPF0337 family)
MKPLPWIVAGVGAGVALAYVILNQPQPQNATGWNSVEDSADRTFGWGSKNRISGAGRNLFGKMKEGLGRVAGNNDLADEGTADQAIGSIQNAAGRVGQAAGETIHDLNR